MNTQAATLLADLAFTIKASSGIFPEQESFGNALGDDISAFAPGIGPGLLSGAKGDAGDGVEAALKSLLGATAGGLVGRGAHKLVLPRILKGQARGFKNMHRDPSLASILPFLKNVNSGTAYGALLGSLFGTHSARQNRLNKAQEDRVSIGGVGAGALTGAGIGAMAGGSDYRGLGATLGALIGGGAGYAIPQLLKPGVNDTILRKLNLKTR